MSASESVVPRLHEDPELFREAVRFTAAEAGFQPSLIEKDYFCTVILAHLASVDPGLVFKGGTCLAKVHMRFHRMSEDLDFVLPMPVEATRGERRKRSVATKVALAALPHRVPALRLAQPLTGANDSLQYLATIEYGSCLAERVESIQVEVALREPLLTPLVSGQARTLLLDPLSGTQQLEPIAVHCLSLEEAVAEKFRAALARRSVAIRDFYDLDHMEREGRLRPAVLVELVRQKLAVPGNDPANVSLQRRSALEQQLEAELKPVLRLEDFRAFDLDRAWGLVADMAARLA